MNNNNIWFVTGASKGLGLTLVKRLLKEGYYERAQQKIASVQTDLETWKDLTTSTAY